jgi:hypothetical protein
MRKLITLLLGIALVASTQAKIYYVTPDATAKASRSSVDSWSAPVTLASALDSAYTVNDEIWMKAGTYSLHRTKSTNKAGIVVNSGIKQIYGGFAGTDTLKSQRLRSDLDGNGSIAPWEFVNQTILDGSTIEDYTVMYTTKTQIYSSATTKPTISGSFSNPTVKGVISFEGSANHILDGVVVENGKFDGDSYASGINISVAATVKNCIVRKCFATRVENLSGGFSHTSAGAIRIYGPSVVVDGCLVEDNTIGPLLPGAYNCGAVAVTEGTIKNSVVRNNIAYVRSAGADSSGFAAGELATLGVYAYPTAKTGVGRGAGIYISGVSQGKKVGLVSNCIVANNEIVSCDPTSSTSASSTNAAGITADNAGVIINCVVVNNKVRYADLNTTNTLPSLAIEGIGVYLKTSNPYLTSYPAKLRPTIVACYNTIALGNQGTSATVNTKADITMKGHIAIASDSAKNVSVTSILAPFSKREVKNCIVGGTSLNCELPSSASSSAYVVGKDSVASTNYFTFNTTLRNVLLIQPTGCVFNQTASAVFDKPSTVVGYSATDASIKTANYKLKDATYATAGVPVSVQWTGYSAGTSTVASVPTVYTYTSQAFDMLGTTHAATPAIGAALNVSSVYSPTAIGVLAENPSGVLIKKDMVATTKIVPSIKVYSLNGAVVAKGENTNSISIAHLPSGVYFAVAGDVKVKFVK